MLPSFISYGYITDMRLNDDFKIPLPIETVIINSSTDTTIRLIYKAQLQQVSTKKAVIKLRMKSDTNYLNIQNIPSFPIEEKASKIFLGFSSFNGFFDITLNGIMSNQILTFALDLFQDDSTEPIDTKETTVLVRYFEGNNHE